MIDPTNYIPEKTHGYQAQSDKLPGTVPNASSSVKSLGTASAPSIYPYGRKVIEDAQRVQETLSREQKIEAHAREIFDKLITPELIKLVYASGRELKLSRHASVFSTVANVSLCAAIAF